MKFIFSIIITCFLFLNITSAQTREFQITNETTFKDESGNLVSFDQFLELTSGDGYEMSPVFNEDGSLKEITIIKSVVAPRQLMSNQFASPEELIGHAPPNFAVTDLLGQYFNYTDLRGKVIVIKFWFIQCPPCIKEMPELNQLVQQYKNQEVVFLGFSLDSKYEIQQFLKRKRFDYQLIPDAKAIAHSYNVLGYPTHLIINKNGEVETVFTGVNNHIQSKMSAIIDRLLTNNSQPAPTTIQESTSMKQISSNIPTQTIPQNNYNSIPSQVNDILDDEVVIHPGSIIKNEKGEIISFESFAALMNTNRFTLLKRFDTNGKEFILMKEVGK